MARGVLAGLVAAGALVAQTGDLPKFEAASVRANSSGVPSGSSTIDDGSIVVRNVPLQACIAAAFGVRAADVVGPGWMAQTRFDIVAKAATSDRSTPTLKMYQALLVERFHLKVHSETRSVSGFELAAAKDGIRLRDIGSQPADDLIFPSTLRSNGAHIVSPKGMTLAALADQLSHRLNVPILDKTGTSDYFAVNLEFNVPQLNSEVPDGRPSLFAALAEVGLRLESVKVPMPTIVVDSVDKTPTGN